MTLGLTRVKDARKLIHIILHDLKETGFGRKVTFKVIYLTSTLFRRLSLPAAAGMVETRYRHAVECRIREHGHF